MFSPPGGRRKARAKLRARRASQVYGRYGARMKFRGAVAQAGARAKCWQARGAVASPPPFSLAGVVREPGRVSAIVINNCAQARSGRRGARAGALGR